MNLHELKWDSRFLEMAKLVSTWSKDPKHQVGAVVTDSLNRVLGIGYNGPPRNVKDTGLTQESKVLRSLHAEVNAILNSHNSIMGGTIYVYPFHPCAQCAAVIVQKGISRVVYYTDGNLKTWQASQKEAKELFNEASITTMRYLAT